MCIILFSVFSTDPLVVWLRSYLLGRSYSVRMGPYLSRFLRASSGVPQGSNLGLLLFVLYINDVSTILPGDNNLLYEDDIKIFRQIQEPDDHRILQASLEDFDNWCTRNSLTICVDKSVTSTFSRSRSPVHFDYALNGQTLQRADCVKDLGVFVNAKL